MPYATVADLELVMDPDTVDQLSDDETGAEKSDPIVERCISDADGLIDSYCTARYVVPFTAVHSSVRNASTTIAHYFLCLRRGWTISEKIKTAKDDVVSWLRDVQDSKADIPGAAEQTTGGGSFSADDRIITVDTMSGFM